MTKIQKISSNNKISDSTYNKHQIQNNRLEFNKLMDFKYYESKFCEKAEKYFSEIFLENKKSEAKLILLENKLSEYVPIGIFKLLGDKTFVGITDYKTNPKDFGIEIGTLYKIEYGIKKRLEFHSNINGWDAYTIQGDLNLGFPQRKLKIYQNERIKSVFKSEIEIIKNHKF